MREVIKSKWRMYLSQSSRFVRENVLDLAQVIGQIPASGEGSRICFVVPNFLVEVDEYGLTSPHDFDGYVQRDGNDVLEGDKRIRPSDETVD